jgi:Rhodopirellula transposase DDE domain
MCDCPSSRRRATDPPNRGRCGSLAIADIRSRWRKATAYLDERARRLFAANEALAQGHGGVSATAIATGLARSTINRGIQELRSARNELGPRVRRPGAGRKSAVTQQPGLPAALQKLIEGAIRGDPCSPLRWVSRSQRYLVTALTVQGFKVSPRVVGKLLREPNYSCQANCNTREGSNHETPASASCWRRMAGVGRPVWPMRPIRPGAITGHRVARQLASRAAPSWHGQGHLAVRRVIGEAAQGRHASPAGCCPGQKRRA